MIAMDCQTALEILEVSRPGSDDLSDPGLAAAAAYVESHADCRDEFLRRQHLDRQIGRVMRGVSVPTGLKERLLVGLVDGGKNSEVTADAPAVETEIRTAGKASLHRRTWFRVLASTAACLFAAIVVWQLIPSEPEKFSLIHLHDEAAQAIVSDDFVFDGLDDFPNVGNVALPAGWDNTTLGSIQIEGPKAYTGKAQGSTAVAMYRFNFTDRRNRLVTGYLLVLPADRVTSTSKPPATSAINGRQAYPSGFTSLSWSSGKLVYVCFVPRGGAGDAVEELKELLKLPMS